MSTQSRSVSDPNAKGSSNFLWVIVAVIAIAAIVIGVVVWQAQGQRTDALAERATDTNVEMQLDESMVTLAGQEPAAEAEVVDIYEDFSCSYCAQLAENTDAQMLEEIENGNLIVNIHPMTFMDDGTVGHSTNSLAAALALAEHGDVDAYWSLREILFLDQQQVFNQWDEADYADAAAALGGSDEAVEAIRNGEFVSAAEEAGNANAAKLEETVGEVSTPRIIQDGQEVQVPNNDNSQWINAVLGS